MYAGNGGPTKPDGNFLTHLYNYAKNDGNGPPSADQDLSTAEPRHSHAVCTLRVHPPTSLCPALSAVAELISQGHCRKSHGPYGANGEANNFKLELFNDIHEDHGAIYLCQTVSSTSLQPRLATVGFHRYQRHRHILQHIGC